MLDISPAKMMPLQQKINGLQVLVKSQGVSTFVVTFKFSPLACLALTRSLTQS